MCVASTVVAVSDKEMRRQGSRLEGNIEIGARQGSHRQVSFGAWYFGSLTNSPSTQMMIKIFSTILIGGTYRESSWNSADVQTQLDASVIESYPQMGISYELFRARMDPGTENL